MLHVPLYNVLCYVLRRDLSRDIHLYQLYWVALHLRRTGCLSSNQKLTIYSLPNLACKKAEKAAVRGRLPLPDYFYNSPTLGTRLTMLLAPARRKTSKIIYLYLLHFQHLDSYKAPLHVSNAPATRYTSQSHLVRE